jgi:hypothetical protein
MATKKKNQSKSKKPASKKRAPKKIVAKKKASPKKIVPIKAASPKASPKKPIPKKIATPKRKARGKSENVNSVSYESKGLGARSGGQSGDLQGLSGIAGADSESVDELIEEGNAFEAEIVKGVEDAPDADEGEVRTHEVPEDDVPEEYLEKDE